MSTIASQNRNLNDLLPIRNANVRSVPYVVNTSSWHENTIGLQIFRPRIELFDTTDLKQAGGYLQCHFVCNYTAESMIHTVHKANYFKFRQHVSIAWEESRQVPFPRCYEKGCRLILALSSVWKMRINNLSRTTQHPEVYFAVHYTMYLSVLLSHCNGNLDYSVTDTHRRGTSFIKSKHGT